jgi:hypothetical protein
MRETVIPVVRSWSTARLWGILAACTLGLCIVVACLFVWGHALPFAPIPPYSQDSDYTAGLTSALRYAIGADFSLESTRSPLEYAKADLYRAPGWTRTTTAFARAVSNPAFAVRMTFVYDTDDFMAAIRGQDVAMKTSWYSVVEAIPADRRTSFIDVCAGHWPYGRSAPHGLHITDISQTDSETYLVGLSTDDNSTHLHAQVTWDRAANAWTETDDLQSLPF